MRRITQLCLAFWLSLLAGVSVAQNAAEPSGLPTFYGYMAYSTEWTEGSEPDPKAGYYTFDTTDGELTAQHIVDYVEAEISGTYADNTVYRVDVRGSWIIYYVNFRTYDIDTWEEGVSKAFDQNYAEGVAADMTYSYRDGKVYAVTYQAVGNSNGGYLCEVNPETGEFNRIASIDFMRCVAADAEGKLWTIDPSGNLYKLATDGTKTLVGATGYVPSDMNQSATFDIRTGKLYWALNGFSSTDTKHTSLITALVSVDTQTGEATVVRHFPKMERFSTLFIRDSHPDAPDYVGNWAVTCATGGQLQATVSFTLPQATYAQGKLQGEVAWKVYRDGEEVRSGTGAPGETVKVTLDFDRADNYTLAASCEAGGLQGPRTETRVFVGEDTPSPVTELTAEAKADRSAATLSWKAPETGANGGYIDPQAVTYTVVRYPDGGVVAENLAATTFEDIPTLPMRQMRYAVTPHYAGVDGERTFSNYVYVGADWLIPYNETFDTETDFSAYTVIDANGDGGSEWEDPCWKYDEAYAAAFYYSPLAVEEADDWLITPALSLCEDSLYQLTFLTYGYYGDTLTHLQIACGAQPTAEAMGEPVFDEHFRSSMQATRTFHTYFAPQGGARYLGFHNITKGREHLSIDNVRITYAGTSKVPDRVRDASAVPDERGKALLAFKAPAVDAKGDALSGSLKVHIYKGSDETPAVTLEATPGQELSWTDEWATPAAFSYVVTAENEKGAGIPTTLSVDLSAAPPKAVGRVEAEAVGTHAVRVSWEATDDDEALRYAVYRNYMYETPVRVADNLETTSFIDTKATILFPADVQQGSVSYTVKAINSAGEGEGVVSEAVTVGQMYSLPFSETWYQQTTQNNPWTSRGNGTASWSPVGFGYDPSAPLLDGAGMVNFSVNSASVSGGGTCDYLSPIIDFSTLKNPELQFYIYQSPEVSTDLSVAVGMETVGQGTQMIENTTFFGYSETGGWKLCTVSLAEFGNVKQGQIVLRGTGSVVDQNLHLDQLSVTGEAYQCDARVDELEVSTSLFTEQENSVEVKVRNVGAATLSKAAIVLYEDGKRIGGDELTDWQSGDEQTFDFEYVPETAGTHTLRAEVTADGDEQEGNNVAELLVEVAAGAMPYVTSLKGELTDDGVVLGWQLPDATDSPRQATESFEQYPTFAIADVGLWGLYDGDQTLPFTFQDVNGEVIEWENNDQLQAFIVFDANKTVLAGAILANTGLQSMVSFGAPRKANDDWLISPRLSGKAQLLSFYARGIDSQEKAENFNVLYSTTDAEPAHFHLANGTTPVTASGEWTQYRFELPEGSNYFAIQYVGVKQSGLMVDDVTFDGYFVPEAAPRGYNVYRDNVKLNGEPLTERAYTDTEAGSHDDATYYVTAVYGERESAPSNEWNAKASGIEELPTTASEVVIGTSKGFVHVRGAASLPVAVYTVDGRAVLRTKASSDYESYRLQQGVYVVTVGNKAIKVVVK